MTGLVWLLRLGSSRWWSESKAVDVSSFGGTCQPGLEPGPFPKAVEAPLASMELRLKPDAMGIFAGDPGALEAEVRWGYGAAARSGTLTLLDTRYFGRLERHQVVEGVVVIGLEHELAFAYRQPVEVWSDDRQREETTGDKGLSMLPALAKGDITGRWPGR